MAKENNMFLHIHACETQKEVNDCKQLHNCSPIEYLNSFGLLTNKTILAHCVHINMDGKDLELIKEKGCKIAHCPTSNFKLKSGMMPFQKLLDEKVHVTLGTDGSASNNSLSMLEEMKVCALNAKIQSGRSDAGKVDDIFKVATLNGAQAFNIDAGKVSEINGNTVIKDKNEIYYSAGDFRSNDCIKLLEEADIVVTNPPFSFIIVNHDRLKQPDFSNNARNLEQESINSFQLFCDYRTFFSIKTYTKCIDLFYIWVFNF